MLLLYISELSDCILDLIATRIIAVVIIVQLVKLTLILIQNGNKSFDLILVIIFRISNTISLHFTLKS